MKEKKSLKVLGLFFAMAFSVLIAAATTSKAADWNASLKQSDAQTDSVTLTWNAYLGADNYSIELSEDGNTWINPSSATWTSETTDKVSSLSAGCTYYARVVAYKGSYYSSQRQAIATSESITVGTLPSVADVEDLKQTGATNDSITMTWSPVANATSYTVYLYNAYNDYVKINDTTDTTYTVTGLTPSGAWEYFIIANQQTQAGFTGTSSKYVAKKMKTLPSQAPTPAITNFYSSISVAYFGWNYVTNADGYQFQLYTYNNKKISDSTTTGSSLRISPIKRNVFSKYRVRAYIEVNGQKLYGAWSPYAWYASSNNIKVTRSANRKKITLKWSKIKGATGYKVYLSTKSGSGYKKVKTLSSKKTKCTITKIGKKKISTKKKYYIRLEYTRKVGKKTISSPVRGEGSIGY